MRTRGVAVLALMAGCGGDVARESRVFPTDASGADAAAASDGAAPENIADASEPADASPEVDSGEGVYGGDGAATTGSDTGPGGDDAAVGNDATLPPQGGDAGCPDSETLIDGACVTCPEPDGLACVSAMPCHAGQISCSTGVPTCVDTGQSVAPGTACGTNLVCDSAGACQSCVAGGQCFDAHCGVGATTCGTGAPVCSEVMNEPASPDGASCTQTDGDPGACIQGRCNAPLALAASPAVLSAPGGRFDGTLATLTDLVLSDAATEFAVTIDWGDGSVTQGTATGSAGTFAIGGSHTYSDTSAMIVTVTVTDPTRGINVMASAVITRNFFEVQLPSGPACCIIVGPDGAFWFSEQNAIGRATVDGVVSEFPIPTPNSGPLGITVGPDGNLWFVESSAGQIGRITPEGVITEFAVPPPMSVPGVITLGSDGNLWFTEGVGNTIDRMTVDGSFTEFSIPTPSSGVGGIAAGNDGNLWFTEEIGKIGRITTSGAFTEFLLPNYPENIATGPDGNLWVTVSASIGRVTTSGTITIFPLAGGGINVGTGPDGNLWVGSRSGILNRVTTAGVVTAFNIDRIASSIVTGPDGNLWFTEDVPALGVFAP